jgi:hypothetical protein
VFVGGDARLNIAAAALAGASFKRAMQLLSSTVVVPDVRFSKTSGASILVESSAVALMSSIFQLPDVQKRHGPCINVMVIVPGNEGGGLGSVKT